MPLPTLTSRVTRNLLPKCSRAQGTHGVQLRCFASGAGNEVLFPFPFLCPDTLKLTSRLCPLSQHTTNAKRVPLPDSIRFPLAPFGQPLLKTSLHDFHLSHGAKLVPFAGYAMPVQYSSMGVLQSHHWTRENASLFDVGHMLQSKITGGDRVKFFETVTVADVENLHVGGSSLTVYTNENGGIIDDLIVQKQDDHLFVVSNAGTREQDLEHLQKQMKQFNGDVKLEVLDRSLVALQGPKAAESLQEWVDGFDLRNLKFMHGRDLKVNGIDVHVTRCGYTGEDGFEVSEKARVCKRSVYAERRRNLRPGGPRMRVKRSTRARHQGIPFAGIFEILISLILFRFFSLVFLRF